MAFSYQPKPSKILMCDFRGYIIPEINKIRPVVIISAHPYNKKLVTVIPLSTTEPLPLLNHHYEFISPLDPQKKCWAKCDLVYSISIERLKRCTIKDERGFSQHTTNLKLSDYDYRNIRQCIANYLGFKL